MGTIRFRFATPTASSIADVDLSGRRPSTTCGSLIESQVPGVRVREQRRDGDRRAERDRRAVVLDRADLDGAEHGERTGRAIPRSGDLAIDFNDGRGVRIINGAADPAWAWRPVR